ncbi:uncharacterized protein TM35_000123240 [Trypanosoma theileri]|uniref:Uncharacterized protein n=1 Tax=Trypanosoma theileri TaxID=67003 RepID=A0A1X0NZC2_9TRYP|nr:uncharacterized protein TM35_000123240 [Trypanosoma theileri]ORC89549.1 hypothetical protein TM35_000123240 [Trypanosoma theileri]
MTTMFVQLRRVVYLLVLVQCCTCVAYAESRSSVNEDYFNQKDEEFKYMRKVLMELRITAEESSFALESGLGRCYDYSTLADKAVEKLKSLTKREEAEMSPNNTSTSPKEMKEQWKEEKAALQEAKVVLSNAKLAVNKTRKAAKEINETLTEMEKLAKTLVSDANKFMRSPADLPHLLADRYFEVEKLVLASRKEGEDALSFADEVKSSVQRGLDAAEKAEKNAESLESEVESFQKYLEKHGLKPEDSTTDSQQNIAGNKNEESQLESRHEMKTNTEEENTAQLQHSSHEEVKNVHMNTTNINGITKESSNDERANNIKTKESNTTTQKRVPDSQSNKEQRMEDKGTKGIFNKDNKSLNTSTTTNVVDSHKMSSDSSSSSVSIHLNVTQLSDSSSSPALVHSPLLLLLVSMCVLGCTVVC